MRTLNLETWSRRDHFKAFSNWDQPHFSMCANVDLTSFYPFVKEHGVPFTVAIVYVVARAANEIPEFRYRIRPGEVVKHNIVHPSATIMTEGDLFSFCAMEYFEDFTVFAGTAAEKIASVQAHPTLKNEAGRDDLLFMTAIPWVTFTSFMHPTHLHPADSVPRFAWGKYFHEGENLKMPMSVQGHHALMDGIHMGRFYAELQSYLCHPGPVLGEP